MIRKQKPSVDQPHNIYVESRQYQIKQNTNVMTNQWSNSDLMEHISKTDEGAARMLGELEPNNQKLQQY